MKDFKKLKIFSLSASLLLSSGATTVCHCGRHKADLDGKTFTFINDRRTQTRIDKLKVSLRHRKEENPGIVPPTRQREIF